MILADLFDSESLDLARHARAPSGVCLDLVCELNERWAQGETVDVTELLDRDPELWQDRAVVKELAYEEFCLRKERGQTPDLEEFCARFPGHGDSLHALLDADYYMHDKAEARLGLWPQPGDTFAGYSLLRELGQGKFAHVYLAAEPTVGNRRVALKLSAEEGVCEAATLGRLNHPHIVPVYSVPREPGSPLTALCMPYLGSATLLDVLDLAFRGGKPPTAGEAILDAVRTRAVAGEPVPGHERDGPSLRGETYVDCVARIGAQIAEALAHVHGLGICHCDLKPTNILLSPDGLPWLLDFNLSFDRQAARKLGGTPTYMAPEQLAALAGSRVHEPHWDDARGDLFSLGVILYELLTGRHPFGPIPAELSGKEVSRHLLERQRAGGPSPVRRANPRVDAPLARMIERCLAFDPAERPQSATALAAELRQCVSAPRRARRWMAAHRGVVYGITFLALTVALGVGSWLGLRPPLAVRQYRQAVTAYKEGKFGEAEASFSAVLDNDPHNSAAHFWRAQARIKQERFTTAAEDLRECEERQYLSGPTEASLAYCESLRGNQNHWEISKYYRAAQAAGFRTAEVCNNLGYSWLKLRRRGCPEALEQLDEALRRDPELAVAYHNRALVRQRVWYEVVNGNLDSPIPEHQKLLESAIADIDQALKRGMETGGLYADAAQLYALRARKGRPEDLSRFSTLLREAIRRSEDPAAFRKDPIVNSVLEKHRLLRLLDEPRSTGVNHLKAVRILNPVTSTPE